MLILVVGDLHIPHRAQDFPPEFKNLWSSGAKIEQVWVTGNLCSKEAYDYLRSISPDIHIVSGEFDEPKKYPDTKVINVVDFKIGITHGHNIVPWGDKDALLLLQKQLDVDVLVTGTTHELQVYEHGGKFFVNPGSATGAYSAFNAEVVPSFVVMDVQKSVINLYYYQLSNSEVKVHKIVYKK